MLTAALTLTVLLLLVALGVVCLRWRAAVADVREQAEHITGLEVLARHQCERIDGYRAELDALSIAPPAARAALTPDDPTLLPAQVEQWLREGAN